MEKQCTQCSASFEITDSDLELYDQASPIIDGQKYAIPAPILCFSCRVQRLLCWRNERSIYASTCHSCKKKSISQYAPEAPYTVYCHECFWSDTWSPTDYGKNIDFGRPFFNQFNELLYETPLIALINTKAENSKYCSRIYDGRNNYMSFIALFGPENLIHTYYTMTCKDSVDISQSQYCELCYDVVDAERCYNCQYGLRIQNCRDCFFMEDCIGCSDCIGCKNLRQKQYCIFNEQKTKEEYEAFVKEQDLSSHRTVEKLRKKSEDLFQTLPNRNKIIINSENVTGANIFYCRESKEIYDIYESEYLHYCLEGEKSHHLIDCMGFGENEYCCNSFTIGFNNKIFSSGSIFDSSELQYCYDCYANCTNCFGCVGLKKNKYCILNKQYTKEEYNELVPKIIEHMKENGEWGQFFDPTMSPFAYNEVFAPQWIPLTKKEVLAKGWKWRDADDTLPDVKKTIPAEKLPDMIGEIPDDILNWAIVCEVTGRPFKIVKQELDFYRNMGISIPHLHPDERHKRRMVRRSAFHLWERKCDKCSKDIQASYAPDRPETIYCEECYLKEVY